MDLFNSFIVVVIVLFVFFKQKTAYEMRISDWSSDVCSSDLVAFLQLSIREYPDTDPPIVSVETVYRGAAANVIESRITQVIEDRISGIEGVQTITSRSEDGESDISIEFRPGRSIDEAANDENGRAHV